MHAVSLVMIALPLVTLPRHLLFSSYTTRGSVSQGLPCSYLRQTRKHVQHSCRYNACSAFCFVLMRETDRTHMEKFSPAPAFLDRYLQGHPRSQRSSVAQHCPCHFTQVDGVWSPRSFSNPRGGSPASQVYSTGTVP